MTNITKLAQRLYRRLNSQTLPDGLEFDKYDLANLIEEAIRQFYIISGRQILFNEDKLSYDEDGHVVGYEDDLANDEKQWVILEAMASFYKWIQNDTDRLTSYTTDAMSVTHGDKPYEHLGETIARTERERNRVWYTMTRYNSLGVSG